MDEAVQRYIDGIDPAFRPLFDQIHELVMAAHPEATVTLSYQMPTYQAGRRRIYVGAWQHGISLYGWRQGGDGGFAERHPELLSGKGTIRLRPRDAAALPDDELQGLIRVALDHILLLSGVEAVSVVEGGGGARDGVRAGRPA